jgi:hypothetical protein
MEEWFSLLKKTDYINQENADGLTVDYRISDRKLNTLKASKVLPYKVIDMFKLLCAGPYRQSYDVNIAKTETLKRICTNVTAIYQASKKVLIVGSRDFVLVNYMH